MRDCTVDCWTLNLIKTWCQESFTADLLYKIVLNYQSFLFLGGCNNNCLYTQEVSEDHAENMAAMILVKPPEPLSLEDTTHQGEKLIQSKCDWTLWDSVKKKGPYKWHIY